MPAVMAGGLAGSRPCDSTDAVSDVRPAGRMDGAADTFAGVEGCRGAGGAPGGRGPAAAGPQAKALTRYVAIGAPEACDICTGSTSGGPEPTGSEPCSPAPHPRPRSSPHSPARPCPATSRAAGTGPMPGSRQRQARSSSVSAVAAICRNMLPWASHQASCTAVILHPGPPPPRRRRRLDHLPARQAQRAAALRRHLAPRVPDSR